MSTIARSTNGSVLYVNGTTKRRLCRLSNIEVITSPAVSPTNILVTSLVDGQTYLNILYSDLSSLNGGAVPGTIDAAAQAIAETVFLP